MGNKKNQWVVKGTGSGGKSTVRAVVPNKRVGSCGCTWQWQQRKAGPDTTMNPVTNAATCQVAESTGTLTFGEDDGRIPQPKSGGLTYEDICRLRDARHKRKAAAVAAAAD